MPTQKAFARGAWETGGPEAGWESNLAAFKFVRGRIELLRQAPGRCSSSSDYPLAAGKADDWGMDVLDAGESAGLGGLAVWDGATANPALFGHGRPSSQANASFPRTQSAALVRPNTRP